MADAVIGSAYLQVVPKLDEGALKTGMSSAGKSGSSAFSSSFRDGMSAKSVAIGNIASTAVLKGVDAASKAASQVFVKAFENYAQYEQLAGGVEKIFDSMDASRIFKDAGEAWRDLNISANDYMATINDVGAMFSATMGDEAAYDAARRGMKAISDYSSGTGKNLDVLNQKFAMITRATSSYQSIADQFSGILPATSADFLDQAQAAGLLSGEYSKLTEVPINEYQEALVGMLEKGTRQLGLYGNTAAETAHTISGSIAGMKSAWSNWLVGLADDDADMGKLTDDLVEAVGSVIDNALPRIQVIFERMGPAATDALSGIFHDISPDAGEAFDNTADGVGRLAENLGKIAEQAAASGVLDDVGDALLDITDIIADVDLGPIFEMIGDAIGSLNELLDNLNLEEAKNALGNMGQIPDVLNPETWHKSGEAVDEWNRQVDEAGITAEEYVKLTDREMDKVSEAFESNGNNLKAALESVGYYLDEATGEIVKWNDLGLDDKFAEISMDDGSLRDAQGNVYKWNGTQLLDKDGAAVVDDVDLVNAQGAVFKWNGTDLREKKTRVNVDDHQINQVKLDWDNWSPAVKNLAMNVDSNVRKAFGLKAGGFVRLHASGSFITDGPMNIGADRYGVNHIVGEAGREWVMAHADGTTSVVPIENKKYLEPYASTIASMIAPGEGDGRPNVYVGDIVVSPETELYALLMRVGETMLEDNRRRS